jgi:rhomboid protease GluP
MNGPLRTKLNLVYFPYIFLCIGFILVYTLLNWLLFIRLHIFLLKEEMRNFIIPVSLVWLPLILWYRRRIKLLRFNDKAKNPVMGVLMLAGFAMLAPLLVVQSYLGTASGKLTSLNDAKDIARAKETRYYHINDYSIDRNYTRTFLKKSVSGKSSQYLDLSLYIVCAIYDKGSIPNSDIRDYPVFAVDPLVFIDGKLSDKATLNNLSPEKIASVNILKGASALSAYGLAGKNGVILAKTKMSSDRIAPDMNEGLPDSIQNDPTSPDNGTLISPSHPDSTFYPYAWLGLKYTKQISNRLNSQEKHQEVSSFLNESWYDYIDRPVNGFSYFDNIPYSDDYTEYRKAVNSADRFIMGRHLYLLEPKTEPFEERNGSKLGWIFGSFAIGAVIYFVLLIFIPLDENKVTGWLAGKPLREKDDSLVDVFTVFSPRKGFIATPIIMYANTAVFIAMVIAGLGFIDFSAADLVRWGGNYGPDVEGGQWWRLLTSTFLHGGIMHLAINMYALLFVGIFLEPVIGLKRFVICYLLLGIVASIASYKIHPGQVGVGASGAIFGLYGIFLALLLSGIFPALMKKTFLVSISIFVGFNLIAGLSGNVDNAAHIGGLISGLIAGGLLSGSVQREKANGK